MDSCQRLKLFFETALIKHLPHKVSGVVSFHNTPAFGGQDKIPPDVIYTRNNICQRVGQGQQTIPLWDLKAFECYPRQWMYGITFTILFIPVRNNYPRFRIYAGIIGPERGARYK